MHRILIVDDTEEIHESFRDIFEVPSEDDEDFNDLENDLFGDDSSDDADSKAPDLSIRYEMDHAHQGEESLERVRKAQAEGRPYALIFMDVRMPPGWDGIETISRIWQEFSEIEMVICTAYADYSLDEILKKLGITDHLMFIRKPFDHTMVTQMALALTTKWSLNKSNQEALAAEQEAKQRLETLLKETQEMAEQVKRANTDLKDTQSQLIQSAKLASIGELATGIAHELNQPLSYIRTSVQLQLMKPPEKLDVHKVHKTLKKVEEGTERMINIINHLRYFARQSDHEYKPVQLHDVLEDSMIMFNEQFKLRNIELEKNLAPSLPEVLGNPHQLEQVFLNILSNARDAMEEIKQAKLIIETESTQEGDQKVVILRFTDNGTGIPKEVIEKIFDPFFTTKEVGKGTGLGLSISYGLITDHHGKIKASSVKGEGTTFTITLPAHQA